MIYCVEDDANIRELVAYTLQTMGFEAKEIEDGKALKKALAVELPELILLDIMLPGEDGLTLLKQLKADTLTRNIPVIMVTAKGAEYDKVIGLDLGADDYLAKPFALEELEARVRSLLRREFVSRDTQITVGKISLDTLSRSFSAAGQHLELTPREFAILEHLTLHQDRWISQEELMDCVLESSANPFSNVVRMHISSLRKKLRECLGYDPIQTKVGTGYRLAGKELS